MITEEQNITEEPVKKKRGRPKKYNPCSEFPDYLTDIFESYVSKYDSIIKRFIDTDSHIDKETWNMLYMHIKDICNILKEHNSFWFDINECTYKSNSLLKDIDLYREKFRKHCVKKLYDTEESKRGYRGFLIFSHLKVFIVESSK